VAPCPEVHETGPMHDSYGNVQSDSGLRAHGLGLVVHWTGPMQASYGNAQSDPGLVAHGPGPVVHRTGPIPPHSAKFWHLFCKEGPITMIHFGAIKGPHGTLLHHTSIPRASLHSNTLPQRILMILARSEPCSYVVLHIHPL
jgi:hypothetical protein